MMKPKNDWNTAASVQGMGSESITPGGHTVRIVSAAATAINDKHGQTREVLEMRLEIAEGSRFDGMMTRASEQIGRWPASGLLKQFTADWQDPTATNPRFKGLITAIEESNPGYQWDWNERSLTGKRLGVVFREEEYTNRDGEIRTITKPWVVCSLDKLADQPTPAKKPLDKPQQQAASMMQAGFEKADNDDELPF